MNLLTKVPLYILSFLSISVFANPSCCVKTTKEMLSGEHVPTRALSSTLFNDSLNFTAASAGDTLSSIFIPQNLNGWVGTEQYILMTYGVVRSFSKETGLRDNILNVDSNNFFGVSTVDVRIAYNRFAKRWLFSCEKEDLDTAAVRDLVLVVSESDVITETSKWFVYTIPYIDINPNFPAGALDYQQLASDAHAIYIVANGFADTDETIPTGSCAVVIELNSALSGGPLVFTPFPELLGPPLNSQYLPPADNFNANPTYGYLINAVVDYNNAPPTGSNQVAFFRISDTNTATPSITGPIFVTVPQFGYADVAPHKGNLYGVEGYLQSGNALMWAPHVRGNYLFAAHDIQVDQNGVGSDTGDRIGVRWYQFDLTGGTGVEAPGTVPTLVQSGTLYDNAVTNPKFYFNASIMTNKNLDLVISCTVSGQDDYTNVVYAARKATDAPGTLRDPVMLTNEQNSYNYGTLAQINAGVVLGQRWGDESALSPDPVNDLELWNTQQLASTNNAWAINVTKLVPVA